MVSLVVDASVAVKWVIDEPGSTAARRVAESRLFAPGLLLVECGNALWRKVRAGNLTLREAEASLAILQTAPVEIVANEKLAPRALRLAAQLDHPIYDCLYLALALERRVPMVTADRRFIARVRSVADLAGMIRPLGD